MRPLTIGGRTFRSRLFVGTGKFASHDAMSRAVAASEAEVVTVALKRVRVSADGEVDSLLRALELPGVAVVPNTSGVRDAREAVLAAQLSREALETNWVKLEIHPDVRHLLPDPVETLRATEILARLGFVVLPYCSADPILCKRLEDVGAAAVMPLAAPIGSNRGLETRSMLELIVAQSGVPVVIDAGLGAPSHAAAAMELGADAVLVNTAIAVAGDSEAMAAAFAEAVRSGRRAYEAGLGGVGVTGVATSPTDGLVAGLEE
ncbi:MAG: thiazole synthase [Acidobacteria bacterium]|nr:thiazole synthase [Acidobacteriota bacterium]